jgi:hypothetical protein
VKIWYNINKKWFDDKDTPRKYKWFIW